MTRLMSQNHTTVQTNELFLIVRSANNAISNSYASFGPKACSHAPLVDEVWIYCCSMLRKTIQLIWESSELGSSQTESRQTKTWECVKGYSFSFDMWDNL